MSDEAHYLTGYLNKQNNRFWGTENPSITHEEPVLLKENDIKRARMIHQLWWRQRCRYDVLNLIEKIRID